MMATRRRFLRTMAGATGALGALAACGNGVGSNGAATIDARVDATRDFLFRRYPGTQDLASQAAGVLYIPLVTEAGLGLGGAYGRGALRINDISVDYYSAVKASAGLQIGVQQAAQALFFMTPQALAEFRAAPGWAAGADLKYAVADEGGTLQMDTTTSLAPVIALVFGQAGLMVGASVAGTKYTRIIP